MNQQPEAMGSATPPPQSPLNDPVWRLHLGTVAGCAAAWVAHHVLGQHSGVSLFVVMLLAGGAWFTSVRLLLLDTRARRFWIGWLAASLALVVLLSPEAMGRVVAIVFSGIFLIFRKYRPYRHLAGRRRAIAFLMGILALLLLSAGWDFGDAGGYGASWFTRLVGGVARYSLGSLRLFWIFTLVNLFVRMRLHSFRLKPKLAISALFIALVPILLILTLGLLAIYGVLGGSRAARTRAMLQEWEQLADRGVDLSGGPFASSFSIESDPAGTTHEGVRPLWLDFFIESLAASPTDSTRAISDSLLAPSAVVQQELSRGLQLQIGGGPQADSQGVAWAPVDTTAYFRFGTEIWLIRVRGIGADHVQLRAYEVDSHLLDHLSAALRCDVGLYTTRSTMVGEAEDPRIRAAVEDTTRLDFSLQGRFRSPGAPPDSIAGFWRGSKYFGGDILNVIRLTPYGLQHDQVLLHLKVRLSDLSSEFLRGDFMLNQAVLIVLGIVACLFLVMEGFALYVGIRITGGITSAVRELEQGTLRLAAGDLDAQIHLPNEDEFGDLAASFNAMTVAVKRGREEAVQRERLERELATAREIQQRLLPDEIPSVPGFDITGLSIPSRQVGGDYFDFLVQPDGRVGIAIADVSGKGIPAALLMSNLQASLHGQVIHRGSVGEMVARVNDLLVRSTDVQMFATFFYGVLDQAEGTFTSTNAGHNPPILRRSGGEVEHLARGGLLIGMMAGHAYEQETVVLGEGDVLVLFTDGITEAEGPEIEGAVSPDDEDELEHMFGERRLLDVVAANAHLSAVRIREAILSAVSDHTAGVPQSDDITLVVIKRTVP